MIESDQKIQCVTMKNRNLSQLTSYESLENLWTPKAINRKSSLQSALSAQFKDPETANFSIIIGDDVFTVPLIVLQSYSKFFQGISSEKNEIHLSVSDISANIFHMIYVWMLSSAKVVRRDNLVLLLMGARVSWNFKVE